MSFFRFDAYIFVKQDLAFEGRLYVYGQLAAVIKKSSVLALLFVSVCGFSQDTENTEETAPDYSKYSGYVIEDVIISTVDVFDTSTETEFNPLFVLANRLHIDTKRGTVKTQLLLDSGDSFSVQKLEESERILRRKPYLFDATVVPVENDNGTLDLHVETRDNWTLVPEVKVSSTGGENESSLGIEEENFLGTGTRVNIRRDQDDDRTSSIFQISREDIGEHRLNAAYGYGDLSDGDFQLLQLQRPFFSLDTKWAAGSTAIFDDRIETLFSEGERGARYRDDQTFFTFFGGLSEGLVDGKTERWILGYEFSERNFETVATDGLVEVAPENRRFSYPFLRYQRVQDSFLEAKNLNQIQQTEDVSLGENYSFTVGYASEALDSDRNAWILAADYRHAYGSPESFLVLFNHAAATRVESGKLKNAVLSSRTEIFKRQSEKRLLFGSLSLHLGEDLDLDNFSALGGDVGLRGYPRDFLNAETTALLTVEQRFYTDYYPFRLLRVGAAIFADVARAWGEDAIGVREDEVLANVGFGLRLGSTRSSSNRVFHVDIAFPLTANDNIDKVQIQFSGQRRF